MKNVCCALVLGVLVHGALAEDLVLRKGLIIRSAPGFSDYIARKDPIESVIVEGKWRSPRAGEVVKYNDTLSGVWEDVVADSAGWFHHELLGGAYVSFEVELPRSEILLLQPMGNSMAYVNGEPRAGNPYGYKDVWDAWEPRFDYTVLPVQMHAGRNWLLFKCNRGSFKARLTRPVSAVLLNARDCTLPDLVEETASGGSGAIVIVNASNRPLQSLQIGATTSGEKEVISPVPLLQAMSARKVGFAISSGRRGSTSGLSLTIRLLSRGKLLDTATLQLRVVKPNQPRKITFVSSIDGSVQYYAVNPASDTSGPKALVLSLHGAGVEAINQASSYAPKSWATIVCPTNRRPYGFNWEDWGRTDALEVLSLAKKQFHCDESRVYLTGHSMGGHGTYHVGSLFPDQFAAIGPSAGWLSFWSYRVRDAFQSPSVLRQMLMRPALASDTFTFARNFADLGVYILHGSEDDNVLPEESRSMAAHLANFHRDFIYYEQKGAGHWWDNSDEPGADCVDWASMFDFFARHARPESSRVREVHFATPNPGVSSRYYWAGIEAQTEQLKTSRIDLRVDPGSRRFAGTTENVRRLSIDTSPLRTAGPVVVELDSQKVDSIDWPADGRLWFQRRNKRWSAVPRPSGNLKSPQRYGTFRDVIRNNVLFIFGTSGNPEENRWAFAKSRFDAERFWYQGNGSIEVLADTQFVPSAATGRNVLLYGNASTNRAWKLLLVESPVQIRDGAVQMGEKEVKGNDLSCIFVRPKKGSENGTVGAIGGTGIVGMRGTNTLPYLLPGIGFPDLFVMRADALTKGEEGVVAAGFFGDDWSIETGELVWNE